MSNSNEKLENEMLSYKERHFTKPELNHSGYAYYAIRTALLKAISELKMRISGQVVDLGCGIMPYREFIMENGKIDDYIGIDLQFSDYHNKIKPTLFWDGKSIPLENESCDWIIATEFLEHYHDTQAILKEIYRVLKPNGTLFFTVPFVWNIHEAPYDEFRFTSFSLEKHFREVGFNEIEIKPLGGVNRSLAITIGLWLDTAEISSTKKRIYSRLIRPFYKRLLKNDTNAFEIKNGTFPSGFYGFIKKR